MSAAPWFLGVPDLYAAPSTGGRPTGRTSPTALAASPSQPASNGIDRGDGRPRVALFEATAPPPPLASPIARTGAAQGMGPRPGAIVSGGASARAVVGGLAAAPTTDAEVAANEARAGRTGLKRYPPACHSLWLGD